MPYDAVRSRTHRNGKQDLILFDGLTDARSIGAKASHQGSRLPSERPRISPDYSGKVPLSRGKINIPASDKSLCCKGQMLMVLTHKFRSWACCTWAASLATTGTILFRSAPSIPQIALRMGCIRTRGMAKGLGNTASFHRLCDEFSAPWALLDLRAKRVVARPLRRPRAPLQRQSALLAAIRGQGP